MKNIITITAAVLMSAAGLSQNNEISLESYQSFRFGTPNSFGVFDSDYIILNDGSDQSGTKFSIGLNYTRKLKGDWFIRFRPGVSLDSRKDKVHQLYYDEFGYDEYQTDVDIELKHTTVNLFLGAGKEFKLSDRFSLAVGLDLGFIADMSNSFSYDASGEYHFENSTLYSRHELEYRREFAKYKRIGVMPIISPKFYLSESFSIAVELQYLAMFSMTNGEEEYVWNDTYKEFNPNLQYEYSNETNLKFNSKASMFSASKMSPLIRLTYRF